MKITWLGQAGLLFETDGKVILLDPYLSDSVERIEPHNRRRVPVDPRFLSLKPDLILLTHNHLDHTDPETLCHYLGEDSAVTVLASGNAWENIRRRFGGIQNNYVLFNRGTEWTEGSLRFRAVRADIRMTAQSAFCWKPRGKPTISRATRSMTLAFSTTCPSAWMRCSCPSTV